MTPPAALYSCGTVAKENLSMYRVIRDRAAPYIVSVAIIFFLLTAPAAAQLPTATGRQISMSDPAWKIFIPSTYQQRPGNVADLLVHFHGDPQTFWNNAKYANLNAVIVTVNYD